MAKALTNAATEIRPVWFSSQGYECKPPTIPPRVVFVHGRLEAEDGEAPFAAPAELYSDFCRGLAETMEPSQQEPKASVLLLEYDNLLSKELPREPRDLSYGPVSSALAEAISTHVLLPREKAQSTTAEGREHKASQLVLISFSMGASMALKLLHNSDALKEALTYVVLIEPVWRCWLPFAVSGPRPILAAGDTASPSVLALYGTRDDQTQVDSGGSVKGSLRPLLPDLETLSLKGGNHWGILTEAVAGEIARERLLENGPEAMTPTRVQANMITAIATFCGWGRKK